MLGRAGQAFHCSFMNRISLSILYIFGLLITVSVWVPAWLVTGGYMKAFYTLNGYPAQMHHEMAAGIFFLPVLSFLLFRNLEKTRVFGIQLDAYRVLAGSAGITLLLMILSIVQQRIFFHVLLLFFFSILWILHGQIEKSDSQGKKSEDFLNFSLLMGSAGSLLFLVFDLTNQSNAYLTGKIFIYYGSMNLAFIYFFARLSGGLVQFRSHQWSLILYIISLFYEFISLIFIKERPPIIIGAGIRAAISLYWIFSFVKIQNIRKIKAWNILLWLSAFYYGIGMTGSAIFSEDGVHFAHFFFAGSLTFVLLSSLITKEISESKSGMSLVWTVLFLAMLAGATRGAANLIPSSYQSHLLYSSISMTTAAILYILYFLKKKFS